MSRDYGRYNQKYYEGGKMFGRYNPNASSLEKYDGNVSTLAVYCSQYRKECPRDWKKEKIAYGEANTNYAMNVLKSYAYGKEENKIIACYCALYVLKHSDKFSHKCSKSQIWIEFDDCTIFFCKKQGIKCTRKKACKKNDCSYGWVIIGFPFFFLFILLIILAFSRRRRY